MNKITEIIPDNLPDWAQEAMDNGQFFKVAIKKVAELEAGLTQETRLICTNCAHGRNIVDLSQWHGGPL